MFGRIPRPVGDLISDSKALTISPQLHPEQQVLQPKFLRAEAWTALAQFSASQAVKRAILRRTPNQTDLSALQPGEAVAFWRMSGKSRQHKRGSWNLASFLAFDPDRKSCWDLLGANGQNFISHWHRTASRSRWMGKLVTIRMQPPVDPQC